MHIVGKGNIPHNGGQNGSQGPQNGLKTPPNTPQMVQYHFLKKVILDPFLTIFDLFSVDTHGPKSPEMRLNGHSVRLGHSEGWEPPQVVGVCTWENCPQIRDSVLEIRPFFGLSPQDTFGAQTNPFGAQRTPVRSHTGPNTAKRQPKQHPSGFCPSIWITEPSGAPPGGTGARFW